MSRLPRCDPNRGRVFPVIAARLKRRIRRDGVPDLECEDCVQEVWLALLEAHPEWTLDEPRTRAWLLAVAHNKALDFHRRRHRHPSRSLDELRPIPSNDPLPGAGTEVDREDPHQELLSALQGALTRISEVNREIFMRRAQGETNRQIGNAIGLTPDQVKWRYHRVLAHLRTTMRSCTHGRIGGGGVNSSFSGEAFAFPALRPRLCHAKRDFGVTP